ncbi:phage tail fiber protein [Xenorhabdus stockiae]|uniref:phage tail fiber protein n=1 Tax=Xenorhabdus stockiae TaxID=351614 RepID=UPI0040635129
MIYSQGTLSTVSGSAIVRGTGTKFKDNLNGIAPGQVILIQSDNSKLLHLIQAVNSDTELVLADNVNVTLNHVTYQIQTTVPNSISDGVRHMVAINAYIVQFLQNMDKWMSQNGAVNVTLPNGQTVSLQSIKAMNEVIAGKVPIDRKINGQSLSSDIQLIAKDIAAVSVNPFGEVNRESPFQHFLSTGFAVVNIPRVNEVSDFPVGLYNFGMLEVQGGSAVVSQRYTSHIGEIAIRQSWNGGDNWNGWYTNWTTANTHVDNSGIIRKASPIIEIFPLGKFSTNDESEGATVSKLGLGHYQVTGVLGYNADGAWGVHGGISSPKNNNGLELIYIDDKVNKDGSITIETFHRQHSHLPERFQNQRIKALVNGEKVYYQDGEPCDIPEGCRLDVRVQMPENSVWNMKQKAAEITTDSEQAGPVE